MRLVPNEDVHPVLVGHRGGDLFLHVQHLLHLHLVKFLVNDFQFLRRAWWYSSESVRMSDRAAGCTVARR